MADIKFKNGHLEHLVQVLEALELNVKESRMRTRFKRMLVDYVQNTIVPERKLVIDKYAMKKEDGSLMFSDEEKGTVLFEDAWEEEEAIKHLNELDNEMYVVILDAYNEMMIKSIANSLLKSEDIKVNGMLSDWLDEWCEEFEKALEFYEESNKSKNKE